MKDFYSYKGSLNGVQGIWAHKVPKDVVVQETHRVYVPDEGKIFKKGNEYAEVVFDTIRDWEEVDDPNKVPEEGGKDETTVD